MIQADRTSLQSSKKQIHRSSFTPQTFTRLHWPAIRLRTNGYFIRAAKGRNDALIMFLFWAAWFR